MLQFYFDMSDGGWTISESTHILIQFSVVAKKEVKEHAEGEKEYRLK